MDTRFQLEVPAPFDHVQYVLNAVDEYPIWNSAIVGTGRLRWELEITPSRRRALAAAVATLDDVTRITLSRGRFPVVRWDVRVVDAARTRTQLGVAIWCSSRLVMVPKVALLRRMVRRFADDLGHRARWLPSAPDTSFGQSTVSTIVPQSARTASLEQLLAVSRELEGSILAVESATSSCLLDLENTRFARAEANADVRQLVHFGRWQTFVDVICEGGDVVVVPAGGAARVRIRVGAHSTV